jgi:hypothetical protein
MSARGFYSDAFQSDDTYVQREFYSGERICPPSARSAGNALLRAYVFSFAAIAGVWALLDHDGNLARWTLAATTLAEAKFAELSQPTNAPPPSYQVQSAQASAPAVAVQQPPSLMPTAAREVADAPGTHANNISEPAAAEAAPAASAPEDALRKRAEAVGLHPDLSRVLLARLSDIDYRNAATAISKALAETPDDEAFVWPRRRTPQLALFRVHFVEGAAPSCRRYVVTIVKDRWSTTALPMEKCGLKLVRNNARATPSED